MQGCLRLGGGEGGEGGEGGLLLPCVAVLQRQFRLLQLKKMLQCYGVRDFNFSDTSKGRVSVCFYIIILLWSITLSILGSFYLYFGSLLYVLLSSGLC